MNAPTLKNYGNRFHYLLFATLASLLFSNFFSSLFISLLFINAFTGGSEAFKRSYLLRPLVLSYLFFFGAYVVSLLYTDSASGWHAIEARLSFLLLPIAIGLGAPASNPYLKKLLCLGFALTVTLAAVFSILSGVWDYFETGSWYTYWPSGLVKEHHLFYTGLAAPLMHPAYFSLYCGIAIFIVWHYFFKFKYRWLPAMWMVFLFVFLILLQGRMNILAFLLIVGVYLVFRAFSQKRYKLLGAFAALAIVGLSLLPFLPASVKDRFLVSPSLQYDLTSTSMADYSGFTIRLAEWHCALPLIKENLPLGVGVGDSQTELINRYRENNFVLGVKERFNCHNQFLETTLATGVLGLIPLLLILVSFIWISIKNRDVILAMASLFFFMSMLTESMLERHWAITLFCSLLLYLGLVSKKPAEVESSTGA